MSLRTRSLVVAAALAAPIALAGAQSSPAVSATVDRAVQAWQKVKTVRGTFVQTLSNPLTGGTATARGEFYQQRPSRLAIRFTEPSGDRIVADGKALWVYLPSATPGQVVKRSLASNDLVPVDLTGQFLSEPKKKYELADGGAEPVDGSAAHVVLLTPRKGTTAPFTKAKVWISDRDATIRQFEVVDGNGITRRVRLATLDLNATMPKNVFRFDMPKGARVVDETR